VSLSRITLLAAGLVFAMIAVQMVLGGPILQVDEDVAAWLAAHRRPAVTTAMLLVSEVNETFKLLAVAILLAAWRWLRGDRPAALALAVVPGAELLNLFLKQVFQRVRPLDVEPLAHLVTYSFPSGHAVAASAFYGVVCALVVRRARSRPLRLLAIMAGMVMVPLVCFSRMYLGAHYLSDVLAGACVGIVGVVLVFGWAHAMASTRRPLD
jgi:membrane-associated phospholipid phosphatase